MSSLVLTESRKSYAAQRGVSQGAAITLIAASGGYAARFECTIRAALVLGDRNLTNHGFPAMLIPTEDVHRAITKLAQTFSVALVDTVTDEAGTRFVLVWKIVPRAEPVGLPEEVTVDVSQGLLPTLDEY